MAGAARPNNAVKWRDQTIVTLLEKLARHRELNDEESVLQERTVRRLMPKRDVWRWTPEEDRKLKSLIRRRPIDARYSTYGKPFQRDDQVRKLAEELGRTEWAVRRRMERLRKCSKAAAKAKG